MGATTCMICHARLPKGREREKAANDEAEQRRAREDALRLEEALKAIPKATMEREGYSYRDTGAFPPEWGELVERAALAAEELLSDARSERKMETINSHRRQLRFWPEGVKPEAVPAAHRYVELSAPSHQSILQCAQLLKAQLGPEMASWEAQDLYVLHTPREEEGSKARAAQSWHLDSLKKFAVAALVLRGSHATEFPVGPYSDFSAGVSSETLESWTRFLRCDGLVTDAGYQAESVDELDHFTHHLSTAQLTTGAH
eukprot:3365993-Prymnesium_polylepis.1